LPSRANLAYTLAKLISDAKDDKMKQKLTALVLCWFFGWMGGHKFYLGQAGVGIIYFLFCWTLIPPLIAFFEFWFLLFMSDAEFDRRFNGRETSQRTVSSATEATEALARLKRLYDEGIITPEEYEQKRQNLLRQI
jgi:TM2 domain-containing membrane protein YozV